ncbi:MAG: PilN domain-containing protein [Telluria sp.]
MMRHVQRTASRAGAAHPQVVPSVRWERLFQALEVAASPDVSLLAFDPAPQQRRLRLDGEARDLAALLDYLRRLGSGGTFVQVRLQSHQAVRDDPQHPVRFTVLAHWGEGR